MPQYLFVFGYESPAERNTNSHQGTDFESSNAVWIMASSKEQALEVGRQYAEKWVGELFHSAGIVSYEGWMAGQFAHWIEGYPLERFSGMALETFEEINAEPGAASDRPRE
jgi:hypothetical protein